MAAASQFFPLSSSLQWQNKAPNASSSTISSSLNPQFKHKRPSIYPLKVSLSDPQTTAPSDEKQIKNYNNSPAQSKSKTSVWVNPKSKLSKEAIFALAGPRPRQPDLRLIRLTGLASSLDKSEQSDQAVSAILSAQTFPISEADAVLVIDNMTCAENAVFALRWFLRSIQHNKAIILYNVTFKILRKAKNWPQVESLWEEMLKFGTKPDDITFTTIISCARQCNLHAKAIEWYEKMPDFGCRPSKFTNSAMITSYWHAGQSDKAMELYDQARSMKGQLFDGTFGYMMSIYAGSGNFDGALNVFEEMKARGVRPNLVTYNTLLNAMLKAERPWQVKTIYTDMCNSGVLPDRYTYVTVLRAYSKGRYSNDALVMYQTMKEAGMELDKISYNMLLAMCADVGMVKEAKDIFDEMKKLPEGSRPDDWSYSAIITAYSCIGQVSDAEKMFNEMLDVGIKPTIFVLTSLIQCYGNAQQIDSIMQVIGMLPEFQVTPDDRFCGCLLHVAAKTPSEEFSKIVDCIDSVDPSVGSFVNLLVDKNSSVQIIRERATELLDDLSKEVKKPYVNCLIDICIKFEQTEKARELFDLAVESEIYFNLQEKQEKQWILQVKGLSCGAALTAVHAWMHDVLEVLQKGEELPPLLGIRTGHGKHTYGGVRLISVLKEKLAEMDAPFHELPDRMGWLLTTDVAAKSWIEGTKKSELVSSV